MIRLFHHTNTAKTQTKTQTFERGAQMKTAIKLITTAAAIAGMSNVAYAQASETVDVNATITKRTQLAVTVAPPSFGEISVPGDDAQTCSYILAGDGLGNTQSFVTGATTNDPNPDTELCQFGGAEFPATVQVTCETATDYTFDVSTTTAAPAAALGLNLTASAPLDKGNNFSNKETTALTCGTAGFDELSPSLKLTVPGTAEAFNGTVGTMAVSVNY